MKRMVYSISSSVRAHQYFCSTKPAHQCKLMGCTLGDACSGTRLCQQCLCNTQGSTSVSSDIDTLNLSASAGALQHMVLAEPLGVPSLAMMDKPHELLVRPGVKVQGKGLLEARAKWETTSISLFSTLTWMLSRPKQELPRHVLKNCSACFCKGVHRGHFVDDEQSSGEQDYLANPFLPVIFPWMAILGQRHKK